jgi:restriction endonuclease S subunit
MLVKRTVASGVDLQKYTVRADDIVLTCRGTQLKIANVTPESAGALISANLIAIRPGPMLLPAVLLAFLQSSATQKLLLQRAQSSTSSISLTTKSVTELPIPVPPLPVQEQIAELVIAAEESYAVAIRAAEQRRAVAHRVAFELLRGKTEIARQER